jgi:prolipoprotein diacylglyceryltransferase
LTQPQGVGRFGLHFTRNDQIIMRSASQLLLSLVVSLLLIGAGLTSFWEAGRLIAV